MYTNLEYPLHIEQPLPPSVTAAAIKANKVSDGISCKWFIFVFALQLNSMTLFLSFYHDIFI